MATNKSFLSKKIGLPPGTLIHIGNKKTENVKVSYIDYTKSEVKQAECNDIKDCYPLKDTDTISWINIDGLNNIELIQDLGIAFELDNLVLEDILNTNHRPKTEQHEGYIFLTLRMLGISESRKSVVSEQVSFILGKNWLISFQEQQGDIFNAVRARLNDDKSIIRQHKVDFLFYRLIDTVVDNYFFVSEYFSDEIEKLEERVLKNPSNQSLHEIQDLKKQLIKFKKSVVPLREAVMFLQKESSEYIKKETLRYMRDVYDHLIQMIDNIDTQKDMLSSVMDLYLSGVSNKMNEIMKVLTIMATIFIPLTFIAGIYGMNFEIMPELKWKYGYLGVWGVMILVLVLMLVYFKRKKWL